MRNSAENWKGAILRTVCFNYNVFEIFLEVQHKESTSTALPRTDHVILWSLHCLVHCYIKGCFGAKLPQVKKSPGIFVVYWFTWLGIQQITSTEISYLEAIYLQMLHLCVAVQPDFSHWSMVPKTPNHTTRLQTSTFQIFWKEAYLSTIRSRYRFFCLSWVFLPACNLRLIWLISSWIVRAPTGNKTTLFLEDTCLTDSTQDNFPGWGGSPGSQSWYPKKDTLLFTHSTGASRNQSWNHNSTLKIFTAFKVNVMFVGETRPAQDAFAT